MRVIGKGTKTLNCVLPNGKIQPLRINNCLHVPELDSNLFSYRAVRRLKKGFNVTSNNDYEKEDKLFLKLQDGTVVLEARLNENLYTIVTENESALSARECQRFGFPQIESKTPNRTVAFYMPKPTYSSNFELFWYLSVRVIVSLRLVASPDIFSVLHFVGFIG